MSLAAETKADLSVTQQELEQFLFLEAALLDDWALDDWLTLFAPGAEYFVPPAGSDDDVNSATTLFYVADDYHRLTERVKRLKKRTAHVEYPHSRCRRMITNIRILGGNDAAFDVTSNFITFRTKRNDTETYFGHHRYTMKVDGGAIKIVRKTSFLDAEDIAEQGKVSIIL